MYSFTINNSTNIVVLTPFSNTPIPQNNVISVSGIHGNGSSTTTFTYNPQQVSAAPPTVAPNVLPNTNTNTQQTGPIVMVEGTTSSDCLLVKINPQLYPNGNSALSPWNFFYTENNTKMEYQFVTLVQVSNNQYQQTILGSGTLLSTNSQIDTYFTNELQYNICSSDILFEFDNEGITIPPGTSRILCKFELVAQQSLITGQYETATNWFPFSFAI
jgi:hypothetical protein